MLEMMGQMMGKKPGEDQDSKSDQGGEGSTGESDVGHLRAFHHGRECRGSRSGAREG